MRGTRAEQHEDDWAPAIPVARRARSRPTARYAELEGFPRQAELTARHEPTEAGRRRRREIAPMWCNPPHAQQTRKRGHPTPAPQPRRLEAPRRTRRARTWPAATGRQATVRAKEARPPTVGVVLRLTNFAVSLTGCELINQHSFGRIRYVFIDTHISWSGSPGPLFST